MTIKMLKTLPAAPDGMKLIELQAGKFYDLVALTPHAVERAQELEVMLCREKLAVSASEADQAKATDVEAKKASEAKKPADAKAALDAAAKKSAPKPSFPEPAPTPPAP